MIRKLLHSHGLSSTVSSVRWTALPAEWAKTFSQQHCCGTVGFQLWSLDDQSLTFWLLVLLTRWLAGVESSKINERNDQCRCQAEEQDRYGQILVIGSQQSLHGVHCLLTLLVTKSYHAKILVLHFLTSKFAQAPSLAENGGLRQNRMWHGEDEGR